MHTIMLLIRLESKSRADGRLHGMIRSGWHPYGSFRSRFGAGVKNQCQAFFALLLATLEVAPFRSSTFGQRQTERQHVL